MDAYQKPVDCEGARTYALHLAEYLNDPTTILAACKRNFSTGIPELKAIVGMIETRQNRRAKRRMFG